MDTQKIECFLAVAKHLNFSRAARELFMAQSSVTQQIQSMENEIGFRLLVRDRQGVRLTPAGESFYADAAQMMEAYSAALKRCRSIASLHENRLVIGYPNPPEWGNMPAFVRGFRSDFPEVRLELRLNKGRELMEHFRSGAIDVLFGDVGYLQQLHGVEVIPLFKAPFYVLIPEHHPLSGQSRVSVADINRYKVFCLSTTIPDSTIAMLCQRLKTAGVDFNSILPVQHREDVVASAYAGIGLGAVPGTLEPSAYQIHVALLDAPEIYCQMGCAYLTGTSNRWMAEFVKAAQAFGWIGEKNLRCGSKHC